MRTILTIALVAIAAVGGVQVYRLRSDVAPLRAEYDRLTAKYADFEVTEPQKYYVARVDTGDPMAFAWRFYEPPGGQYRHRFSFGTKESTGDSWGKPEGSQTIMRLAFEPIDDGFRYFWEQKRLGGRRGFPAWKGSLGDFLKLHWSKLHISVLASDKTLVLPTDQVLTLLTIEVPPELRDELRKAVGKLEAEEILQRPIFQFSFGTVGAMEEPGYEWRNK